MQHQVPGEHVARADAELAGHEALKPASSGPPSDPDRHQVALAVEHQALVVDLAVEVDRELRHAQDRAVDQEQARSAGRAVAHDHAAREPEVAIEPRVQERAAVDLDRQLAPAGARPCSGRALMRRLGLSVCAPTTRNPRSGGAPAALAQATRLAPRTA